MLKPGSEMEIDPLTPGIQSRSSERTITVLKFLAVGVIIAVLLQIVVIVVGTVMYQNAVW